jgi:hypothetical protein
VKNSCVGKLFEDLAILGPNFIDLGVGIDHRGNASTDILDECGAQRRDDYQSRFCNGLFDGPRRIIKEGVLRFLEEPLMTFVVTVVVMMKSNDGVPSNYGGKFRMKEYARFDVQVSLWSRLPGVSAVPKSRIQNDEQATFSGSGCG